MIMRCIDWLGEGVLKLLRLMFLNKAARRAINGEPTPAPEPKTEVAEEIRRRENMESLIAEAVSSTVRNKGSSRSWMRKVGRNCRNWQKMMPKPPEKNS